MPTPTPLGSATSQTEDALPETFHVSRHPAVQHKLALLRATTTEPKKFRELVREISWLLATRRWPMPGRWPSTSRPRWRSRPAPSSPTGSGSCPSCAPAWAWSTPCWS